MQLLAKVRLDQKKQGAADTPYGPFLHHCDGLISCSHLNRPLLLFKPPIDLAF